MNTDPRQSLWFRFQAAPVVVAAVVAAAAGCGSADGPPRATVIGRVSLDGEPLPNGVIRFIPIGEDPGPAAVATISGGLYGLEEVDGPVVGRHRVEIEAADYQDFAIDDEQAFAQAFQQAGQSPLGKNPIPATYNRKSTLTAEVIAEKRNELDFQLVSGGPKK